MGDEADMVLTSTKILRDSHVVTKLDAFFKVRTNVIYEQAKFNRRDQREGESVEHFISALYEILRVWRTERQNVKGPYCCPN